MQNTIHITDELVRDSPKRRCGLWPQVQARSRFTSTFVESLTRRGV
jgi:hypothetical protein